MTIKRYVASKDSSITNAFKENLSTRATSCNMGASDVLEVFSLFGRANTSSVEQMRILVDFPISDIYASVYSGTLPDSGVSYYLRLFNVAHQETAPETYTLEIYQVSGTWTEGHGLDMEGFVYDGDGVSWASSSNGSTVWNSVGGDTTGSALSVSFTEPDADLEVDISSFVTNWILYEASGTGQQNFGLMVKLSSSMENCLASSSYYTKRFSARTSEYFFKRPVIEARFNDAKTDDRGNFYSVDNSTSDNSNKLYFYNRPRGIWTNVPNEPMVVRFFDTLSGTGSITPVEGTPITASRESTGKYYITASIDTSEEVIYDRWYDSSENCLWTGSINVLDLSALTSLDTPEYFANITNLKDTYLTSETSARMSVFFRQKNWTPTIYNVASQEIETSIIEKAYYQVRRIIDDFVVLDFNKSNEQSATLMSYDKSGNYFVLDMSLFEPDYQYGIVIGYEVGTEFYVLPKTFKFRVQE